MVELKGIVTHFRSQKIVVAGDLILDSYVFGKAKRISPEAPVPVIDVQKTEELPGGAGNVMLNLRSLGADVFAIGRLGNDSNGNTLLKLLEKEGIDITGIVFEEQYPTSIKNRVIANHQQLVRIDHEQVKELSETLEKEITELIPHLFKGAKALAISDYGKGFLTKKLLQRLIDYALLMEIPIIADPKGLDFSKYRGVTVIKPNLMEAYAASGKETYEALNEVANTLLEVSQAETVMITRSENGISYYSKSGKEEHFPVVSKEVKDVTGAGDTVLALITYCLANECSLSIATKMANIAASMVIEKIGCARVNIADLVRRILDIDYKNKIFDIKQLNILKVLLKEKKYIVLTFSAEHSFTPKLFELLLEYSNPIEHDLILHIKDDCVDESFLNVLASLKEVHFIALQIPLEEFVENVQVIDLKYLEESLV